jgi:quinol monooxygenase YgiN
MVTVGLLVRLEARADRVNDLEALLRDGLSYVLDEPATTAWFAVRLAPATFAIFDVFPDESGRQAHLAGRLAAALLARAGELLVRPPEIERVDVLGAKLPA